MKIYEKSETGGPSWVCGYWNGSPLQIGMGFRPEVGTGEVRHHHPYREYYIILEGAAELEIEGQLISLRPGMVVMVEPGERHMVASVGDMGAHWIVIKEQSAPDTKFLADA